jgi:hypothetical protein
MCDIALPRWTGDVEKLGRVHPLRPAGILTIGQLNGGVPHAPRLQFVSKLVIDSISASFSGMIRARAITGSTLPHCHFLERWLQPDTR